jgi:glutaredoxin
MRSSLLFLLLIFMTSTTQAQSVYVWKDEHGVTHFGDAPQNRQATVTEIGELNSYGGDHSEKVASPAASTTQQPEIVMYSAAWCGVCKKAKMYLSKNKVKFTEYDVDTSSEGKRYYAKLTKKSVPVFLIDGAVKRGFSSTTFDKLLSLKGR